MTSFAPTLRRHLRALAGLAALWVGGGCIVDLERRAACGDGFVDQERGEECDPADRGSYIDACEAARVLGEGDCTEDTCEIVDDAMQCAACGDNIRDEFLGEECDGTDLGTPPAICPSGVGTPRCTADCRLDFGPESCGQCGNGVVQMELGEECEPQPGGIVGSNTLCEDLTNFVGGGKPYTSGVVSSCNPDTCLWDRSGCGFCGNESLETDEFVAPGVMARPEFCDDERFDLARLQQQVPNPICDADEGLRVSVGCADDCRGFEPRPDEDPCCYLAGAGSEPGGPCDDRDSPRKCCIELENPDIAPDDVCSQVIVVNQIRNVCN